MRAWFLAAVALGGCNAFADLDELEDDANTRRAQGAECLGDDDCASDGVCLENSCQSALCIDYCTQALDSCTGTNAIHTDFPTCIDTCAEYPDLGIDGEPRGDTVQCRIYHLGLAAEVDPETHCPHASTEGGDTCVGAAPCNSYCGAVLENCTGSNLVFADAETCLSACGLPARTWPGWPCTVPLARTAVFRACSRSCGSRTQEVQ